MGMTLSPRRQRFVEEWLADPNATQAAIRAGYSPRTAKQQGSRLLTNDDVKAAIQARQRALADQTDVSAETVVAELAGIAFADIGTYLDWSDDGVRITSRDDLPEGASRAISEISEVVTAAGQRTVRLKLHSKPDALDKLGRVLGLFVDRLHVTGQVDRPLRHFTVDQLEKMLELAEATTLEGEATVIEDEAGEGDLA